VSSFVTPFYYTSGTVILITVPVPLRSVIKLRFRFRYGKKLWFLRFWFRNTEKKSLEESDHLQPEDGAVAGDNSVCFLLQAMFILDIWAASLYQRPAPLQIVPILEFLFSAVAQAEQNAAHPKQSIGDGWLS
jgi:hypothetical protein